MDDNAFDSAPQFNNNNWSTVVGWSIGVVSLVILVVVIMFRVAPPPVLTLDSGSNTTTLNGVALSNLEIQLCMANYVTQLRHSPQPFPPPDPQSCRNMAENIVQEYVDYVTDNPDAVFTEIERR